MIIFLKFLQFCFRIIFFAPAIVSLFFMHIVAWITQAIAKITPLKKLVILNIKLVFPECNANQAANALIANTSYAILEMLCVPFFKRKHYNSIIKWIGLENLAKALSGKKGAIILTMHAGNYELTHAALTNLGYPMNIILRATEDPIFGIINRSRGASGAKLINILEEDTYKESLKSLAKNELVYLLADTGALESRHEYVQFLGKKVPVATGWLTMAIRSGCSVVPTLAKKSGIRNVISLSEPLTVTKDNREDIKQKVIKLFEDFIKNNPEQWGMFLNDYETKRMVEGR
ncbi:MAG: lysophospholipid acyltransferase family protein [Candidatus Margulisiibacteriota bacterium]